MEREALAWTPRVPTPAAPSTNVGVRVDETGKKEVEAPPPHVRTSHGLTDEGTTSKAPCPVAHSRGLPQITRAILSRATVYSVGPGQPGSEERTPLRLPPLPLLRLRATEAPNSPASEPDLLALLRLRLRGR